MISKTERKNFQNSLYKWYENNHRKLPWRATKDPYFIWLSEIILQQTRVEQGLPYYNKFAKAFPTVKLLASADEEKVLRLWQGLGYYSRGRNLKKAAQLVVSEFNGQFPTSKEELEKLPGVGDYTASAIASFAFDQSNAVLDGNVFRILARVFNEPKAINDSDARKYYKGLLESIFDEKKPAAFNQAIMEMGALICTPKKPNCTSCPAAAICIAKQENTQLNLPNKKKAKPKQKRFLSFIIYQNNKKEFAFQHRTNKGIWQGLHHPFLIETTEAKTPLNKLQHIFSDLEIKHIGEYNKHILSHQELHIQFIELNKGLLNYDDSIIWRTLDAVKNIGKPVPISKYFNAKFDI